VKKALVVLLHCAVNLFLQMQFGARMVFFYDDTVSNIVLWTLIGIGLIGLDYLVCKRLLKTEARPVPRLLHCADLVLLLPLLVFWGYGFILALAEKDLSAQFEKYQIAWILGLLLVDLCLVWERLRLIKEER